MVFVFQKKLGPTACVYMVPNQIYLCFQSFYLKNPFDFLFLFHSSPYFITTF